MKTVKLTTEGIKKHLESVIPSQALTEYIWNSLDAGATSVDVNFEKNTMDGIESIKVADNGIGIPHELLAKKFGVFLESEKITTRQNAKRISSESHGEDGIGRLTFFKFAQNAEWETVYEQDGKKYSYTIKISVNDLIHYDSDAPKEIDGKTPTGTTASFYNINSKSIDPNDQTIWEFLICEFCWRLLLQENLRIAVQGKLLTAEENMADTASFCPLVRGKQKSSVRFVRWKNKLHKEYSRYYFLDSSNKERWTDFTTLNKKGDNFFHSVYLQSPFFDNFSLNQSGENQAELDLATTSPKSDWFKEIRTGIDAYLRGQRKDFLKKSTKDLNEKFEKGGIWPTYNPRNSWEVAKHNHLAETVGELYNLQPNIFSSGTIEQKKIFVRLIEQLLDTSEADSLFQIIGEVLDLDQVEKTELLDVLNSSRLSSVIKTVKLVQDRYRAIEQIKMLNWNESLGAKEVPHIQVFMEKHFWIIGEEFSMVVAAEKDFEQALRALYAKISLEPTADKIAHPDKNKEMDIFLVRQDKFHNKIHNVVLELKHPDKKLGKKFIHQVETYFEVIFADPRFNAANMEWSYYLIGNAFDSTGYVESQLENAKNHGEASLIFKAKNHKIYVKRWSELITDVELRHQFLNDRLQIQRDLLAIEESVAKTADEVIQRAQELSCASK